MFGDSYDLLMGIESPLRVHLRPFGDSFPFSEALGEARF